MSTRIINQGAPELTAAVLARLPKATQTTDFSGDIAADQSLVWLPDPFGPVDQQVVDLVALVDRSVNHPVKIVMHSVPGTADDADPAIVATWFGRPGSDLVMAHLYAVKMIDELELPYTIIRTPPLTAGDAGQLVGEGAAVIGRPVGIDQVAAVLAAAVTPANFCNQSLGITRGTSNDKE